MRPAPVRQTIPPLYNYTYSHPHRAVHPAIRESGVSQQPMQLSISPRNTIASPWRRDGTFSDSLPGRSTWRYDEESGAPHRSVPDAHAGPGVAGSPVTFTRTDGSAASAHALTEPPKTAARSPAPVTSQVPLTADAVTSYVGQRSSLGRLQHVASAAVFVEDAADGGTGQHPRSHPTLPHL